MKTYQDLCDIIRNRKYNLMDIKIWNWFEQEADETSEVGIFHWGMTTGDNRVSVREISKTRAFEVYLPKINKKLDIFLDNIGNLEEGNIYKFKTPMSMDDLYKPSNSQDLKVYQPYFAGFEDIHGDILKELKSLEK